MPIEDRNVEVGTRLVGRYKGTEHVLEVVQTDEGRRYRLADGREFKSPSSAGKAVMGGVACNGWRFWSVAGEGPVQRASKKAAKAKKPGATKGAGKKTAGKKPKGKAVHARAKEVASYGCGGCGATFGSQKAAVAHAATHTSN